MTPTHTIRLSSFGLRVIGNDYTAIYRCQLMILRGASLLSEARVTFTRDAFWVILVTVNTVRLHR